MKKVINFITKLNSFIMSNNNLIIEEYSPIIYQLSTILETYSYINNTFIVKISKKYFLIVEINSYNSKNVKFKCHYFNKNTHIFLKYTQLKKYISSHCLYLVTTSLGLMSALKAYNLKVGGIVFARIN